VYVLGRGGRRKFGEYSRQWRQHQRLQSFVPLLWNFKVSKTKTKRVRVDIPGGGRSSPGSFDGSGGAFSSVSNSRVCSLANILTFPRGVAPRIGVVGAGDVVETNLYELWGFVGARKAPECCILGELDCQAYVAGSNDWLWKRSRKTGP
jgi:hypothetical protein